MENKYNFLFSKNKWKIPSESKRHDIKKLTPNG
jgi:hypothetical protein